MGDNKIEIKFMGTPVTEAREGEVLYTRFFPRNIRRRVSRYRRYRKISREYNKNKNNEYSFCKRMGYA